MTERATKIQERLSNKAMVTADDLVGEFKISRVTAFKYLKKEKALASINFKGQYHVKNTGLKFNRYGLVTVDGKEFSRHGNLTDTILQLINQSSSGISVAELNRLTGTKTHMQCSKLYSKRHKLTSCGISASCLYWFHHDNPTKEIRDGFEVTASADAR